MLAEIDQSKPDLSNSKASSWHIFMEISNYVQEHLMNEFERLDIYYSKVDENFSLSSNTLLELI